MGLQREKSAPLQHEPTEPNEEQLATEPIAAVADEADNSTAGNHAKNKSASVVGEGSPGSTEGLRMSWVLDRSESGLFVDAWAAL